MASTEKNIQDRIKSIPEFKEALELQRELFLWNTTLAKMNLVEKSLIPEHVLREKQKSADRLAELRRSGWTELRVHNKIHEITWDASANARADRHANVKIPEAMVRFVSLVAKEALAPDTPAAALSVLDVGTGTGVMFDFLSKHKNIKFSPSKSVGVDLSGEMVSVAQKLHPETTFVQTDFLAYTATPSLQHQEQEAPLQPQQQQQVRAFDTVIFNECLHNFGSQQHALLHAVGLCTSASPTATSQTPVSRIVISHPKGLANTVLQHRSNSILVPSPLPTEEQLLVLLDAVAADFAANRASYPSSSSSTQSSLSLKLRLAVAPDAAAPHYLAVVEVVAAGAG